MEIRSLSLVAVVAAGVSAVAAGSAGAACYAPTAVCDLFAAAEPEPAPPVEAQAPPLKLESAVRRPVATRSRSATRKSAADKRRPAVARHAKAKRYGKRRMARARAKPAEAQVRSNPTQPDRAQANATQGPAAKAYALAPAVAPAAPATLVQVVGPDEFNEIDQAAPSPAVTVAFAALEPGSALALASDSQADAMRAISRDMLARKLSAMPRPEPPQIQRPPESQSPTWLQWALSRLSQAYASASAAVRTLFG